MKLNTELNDLRSENEKLKDKVIIYELDNLDKTNNFSSQSNNKMVGGVRTFSNLKDQMQSRNLQYSTNDRNDRTLADTHNTNTRSMTNQNNMSGNQNHFLSNFGQTMQFNS